MAIVTFYNCDPKDAPKTTMPAHLGANAILTFQGKLLLEKRRDSDIWGLIGGGCKKTEDAETYLNDLGLRNFRVRTLGDIARIQVTESDLETVLKNREVILAHLKKLYSGVVLDLEVRP